MKADLHVHSHYSDGTCSIEELIQQAKEKGLDCFALTDHDTLQGIIEYHKKKIDYPVIAGVELSTYHRGKPIHILGYCCHNDLSNSSELINYLDKMKEKREKRIKKILVNLKNFYQLEIDYNEVKKYSHGNIARPHIAREIEKKYGYTYQEVFDHFLNDESKAYVEIDRLETQEGIELLHRNQMIAILAHPMYLTTTSIAEIIAMGIDGIEVNYPGQNKEEIMTQINDSHLLLTGGSDYHGNLYQDNDLGCMTVPEQELERFLKRLDIQLIKDK